MTRTRWIIFAVICVAILGGLAYLSNRNRVDVSNIDQSKIYTPEQGIADRTIGNKDAKVTLIEYGDFECPACRDLSVPLKQVVNNYKKDILFIYRNFPLTNIHPNALAAATAAEAAGQQGKFFEMHDLLFQNQTTWKTASSDNRTNVFRSYAEQLDLNVGQFDAALSNDQIAEKISRDQALGKKSNATGTPTLILNGKKLDDEYVKSSNIAKLEEKIREVLKANGQEKLPKPVNAIE